jgi:hypothetical protein
VTASDVHTQWTETRAVANRGQKEVRQQIADIDNGGEFLNWHLVDYFQKREKPVAFTRSRAYRKNDNARVEVRGSRRRRVYDEPMTPFERLKACEDADPGQIARLEKQLAKLDPFTLREDIEKKTARHLETAGQPAMAFSKRAAARGSVSLSSSARSFFKSAVERDAIAARAFPTSSKIAARTSAGTPSPS